MTEREEIDVLLSHPEIVAWLELSESEIDTWLEQHEQEEDDGGR